MNEKTNEFAAKVVEEIVGYPIPEQNAIFAEIRGLLIKYRQNVISEMDTGIQTRAKEKDFACETLDGILMGSYSPPPKEEAR